MNPSIAKLLLGKTEQEAVKLLTMFKKTWRVTFRDGAAVSDLITNRDDNRYCLIITDGIVEKVMCG